MTVPEIGGLFDRPQPGNSSVARLGITYCPCRTDDPGGVAGPGGVDGPLIGTRPPAVLELSRGWADRQPVSLADGS
ncbi:hypothetical protein EEZ25_30160 [Micromonospora aurantiaca]|nr:hypothetical protein EEZ25_30160 [Micromonospora aurantiaca]